VSNLGPKPQVRNRLRLTSSLGRGVITRLTAILSDSHKARGVNAAATPNAGWATAFVVVFSTVASGWGDTTHWRLYIRAILYWVNDTIYWVNTIDVQPVPANLLSPAFSWDGSWDPGIEAPHLLAWTPFRPLPTWAYFTPRRCPCTVLRLIIVSWPPAKSSFVTGPCLLTF